VPVPRVPVVRDVQRDGAWLLLVGPPGYEYVEVPPEVYLRQFRDTPVDDLDALAELCKLGGMTPFGARPYADLEPKDDRQWQTTIARFSIETGFFWGGEEEERDEVYGRHLDASQSLDPVHAAEVALRVRLMRRATDHFLAYLAGEPLAPAWRDCTDDLDAWRRFITVTGAALRDFQVRVDVEVIGRSPRADDLQVGEVETTLYSAGMLQLVNDLAANETVRRCANEACGRPYVRQLGRSTYGGHRRSGTLYCSSTCARAQYQREKRRRDRAAREERQR
jgi:hypothetical protein